MTGYPVGLFYLHEFWFSLAAVGFSMGAARVKTTAGWWILQSTARLR